MKFLKEHLHGINYTWTMELKHSIENDEPDRRIFDRTNGNQILFLINYFGQSLGTLTLNDGLKIEALISTHLPREIKSELSVFNWLRGVYLYYSN